MDFIYIVKIIWPYFRLIKLFPRNDDDTATGGNNNGSRCI
jgi:hypothetical protein